MFLIKIYIKESYINYYHTIIQMCGQYCILAPNEAVWVFYSASIKSDLFFKFGLKISIICRHLSNGNPDILT